MEKVTFECEVITPMFLSGADGKNAELRVPSIKGMIRYWWRALNGNVKDIEELQKKESNIFGSTDKRSKVIIQISKNIKNIDIIDSLKKEITEENKNQYYGLSYLLYSMFMFKDNQRKYINPGSQFSITMKSYDISCLLESVKSFIYLSIFGAIGSRSRRGGGNFCIREITIDSKNDQSKLDEIKKIIELNKVQNENELKKYLEKLVTGLGKNLVNYTVLNDALIYTFPFAKNNWKDALEVIGSKFSQFRNKHKILR